MNTLQVDEIIVNSNIGEKLIDCVRESIILSGTYHCQVTLRYKGVTLTIRPGIPIYKILQQYQELVS